MFDFVQIQQLLCFHLCGSYNRSAGHLNIQKVAMFLSFVQSIVIVAFTVSSVMASSPALGTYSISDDITVSGLSSGGFMAVQVRIKHEKNPFSVVPVH